MERPAKAVTIDFAEASSRSYDVLIGDGLLGELSALLRERCPAHRYALIADARVAELYAHSVIERLRSEGLAVEPFTFPAGESHKTRESWARLSDQMFAAGYGRDSAVLALGGGVTGDLAGFVAATFMRGIPLVQLPTTLLAMIDSSVGGKTGVDTEAGKNLVGAFLQPTVVVADTSVLRTLEPKEVRAGLVEAVKHGAIADAEYFAGIEEGLAEILTLESGAIARLVGRSVEIKAGVVARDEREGGPRKTLNFGHTIGHAVEALSGYTLLHGEAIAIGLVAEARLGEALGITQSGTATTLQGLLRRMEMPTEIPEGMAIDGIIAATRSDKKARAGRVEYSLIERIGVAHAASGRWAVSVADEAVRGALEAFPSS